jgi:hypothetical protein
MMDNTFSEEELLEMAQRMRLVAQYVYRPLVLTGCHPFIEFCGLMQKYVDVCERAAKQGIQFPFANEHSGMVLRVEEHDLRYLAEKLRCIFGPIIDANPKAKKMFQELLIEGRAHG